MARVGRSFAAVMRRKNVHRALSRTAGGWADVDDREVARLRRETVDTFEAR